MKLQMNLHLLALALNLPLDTVFGSSPTQIPIKMPSKAPTTTGGYRALDNSAIIDAVTAWLSDPVTTTALYVTRNMAATNPTRKPTIKPTRRPSRRPSKTPTKRCYEPM